MKTNIPTGYRADLADLAEGLNDLMADLEDIRDDVQEQADEKENEAMRADLSRIDQALRLLAEDGFPGLAIPAHRLLGRSLASAEMMKTFRFMEAAGKYLSITLADGARQVAELREVIQECPGLRIAIGHFGMAEPPAGPPWHNEDWRQQIMLARHSNVMIESGGITWLYNSEFYPFPSAVRAIREAASLVGWEKLMWGSDYPRTITAITYRMSYDFLLRSRELRADDLSRFLGSNARRFYGFGELPELPYIKNMSE